jgi:hypothetical protein
VSEVAFGEVGSFTRRRIKMMLFIATIAGIIAYIGDNAKNIKKIMYVLLQV